MNAAVIRRRAPLAAFLCWAFLFVLVSCAAVSSAGVPVVVLLSLDGTRADEVRDLPAFRRIARRGLGAVPLRPVFPTNTFPNHVSLVTGVRPARHGIVNNTFRDPERGSFRYENDPSWIEVEPLWSILQSAGRRSAAFHWVGSQGPWRSGGGPDHWREFDSSVPESEKVRQIIAWLDQPASQRPHLITSWFRGADGAGHRNGPDTQATQRTLRRQDVALGVLLDYLDRGSRWSETTLIVVSDHGMAPVTRRVDLAAALEEAKVRATSRGGGGFATVTLHRGGESAREERVDEIVRLAKELGLDAWPRGRGREGLDADHPRFGDVVVMAPVGTGITRTKGIGGRLASKSLNGSHGYSPEHSSMQAMLSAAGRGVPAGAKVATARVLDIAPTVLDLLAVPVPDWMEGRPLVFAP